MQSAVIKFTSLTGEIVETPLVPAFVWNTYEYTLADIEYNVEKLDITALANRPEAIVEITGNENLKEGENVITITTKIPATETVPEEVKTYKIKVIKLPAPVVIPPTLIGKIGNWFNNLKNTVASWFSTNKEMIILGSLVTCILALIGLSIYIIIDHKKYKKLLEQLKGMNNVGVDTSAEPEEENIKKTQDIEEQNTDLGVDASADQEEEISEKPKKEKKIKKEKIKKEKKDRIGRHS